jgi:hypothetical protein
VGRDPSRTLTSVEVRILFKITGDLLESVRQDLLRPHEFAAERVGFISCRVGALDRSGLAILSHDYHSVADEDYVDDPSVGAMMGAAAIRKALQFALSYEVGMFHVHMHDSPGIPTPSKTDLRETAKFVPDFWNVRPEMPHGAVIVSRDALSGRCWYPGRRGPIAFSEIGVVGPHLMFTRGNNARSAR